MQVRELTRLLDWAERTGRIEAADRNEWTARLAKSPTKAAAALYTTEPTRFRTSPPPLTWRTLLAASGRQPAKGKRPAKVKAADDSYPESWLAPTERRAIAASKERKR